MDNLKPCPFCGGEAKTVLADTYPHRGMLHSWFVACKDSECGCELGFYGMDENGTCGTYETEAEAIAAWNTRAERTCRMEMLPPDETRTRWLCSECGGVHIGEAGHFLWPNYCPNCGAKVVNTDE